MLIGQRSGVSRDDAKFTSKSYVDVNQDHPRRNAPKFEWLMNGHIYLSHDRKWH